VTVGINKLKILRSQETAIPGATGRTCLPTQKSLGPTWANRSKCEILTSCCKSYMSQCENSQSHRIQCTFAGLLHRMTSKCGPAKSFPFSHSPGFSYNWWNLKKKIILPHGTKIWILKSCLLTSEILSRLVAMNLV
jgi:hypothetical protein